MKPILIAVCLFFSFLSFGQNPGLSVPATAVSGLSYNGVALTNLTLLIGYYDPTFSLFRVTNTVTIDAQHSTLYFYGATASGPTSWQIGADDSFITKLAENYQLGLYLTVAGYGHLSIISFGGSGVTNTGTYYGNAGGLTNLPSPVIVFTNWVANQYYTNTSGRDWLLKSDQAYTLGATAGITGFMLFSDSTGGHNWTTNCDGTQNSIVGSLAMPSHTTLFGVVTNGAAFIWTNFTTLGTASLVNGQRTQF